MVHEREPPRTQQPVRNPFSVEGLPQSMQADRSVSGSARSFVPNEAGPQATNAHSANSAGYTFNFTPQPPANLGQKREAPRVFGEESIKNNFSLDGLPQDVRTRQSSFGASRSSLSPEAEPRTSKIGSAVSPGYAWNFSSPSMASMSQEQDSPRLFGEDHSKRTISVTALPQVARTEQPVNNTVRPSTTTEAPSKIVKTNQPTFGTASPLRNPLQSGARSVFNVPKPGHARPEHHRAAPPPVNRAQAQTAVNNASVPGRLTNPSEIIEIRSSPAVAQLSAGTNRNIKNAVGLVNTTFKHPSFLNRPKDSSEVIEIQKPLNFAPKNIYPVPQPLYSSSSSSQPGFKPANAFKGPQVPRVDLTKNDEDDEDRFNPDKALGDGKFGDFDPNNYMDAAQASENIKALLEGAFEDEDDKPKTRLRKKKKQDAVTAVLAEKMQALNVDIQALKNGNNKLVEKEDVDEVEEEDDDDDGSVEGLSVKLLPHQIDGLAWMLDKEIGQRKKNGVLPKGGILADDMGLGKTIQALSLILSNPRPSVDESSRNPKTKIPKTAGKGTLVVAPLALIKQWEGEIRSKVDRDPSMKVLVHHGSSRAKSPQDLQKYDVVITTYQTLTSEHDGSFDNDNGPKLGCMGVHWYRVILDEAHSIKNHNAKMTKAAYALESVYRWCLTGTPLQNNLDELQSLIRFLRIKPYSDMANWRDQISKPMKNGRGGLAMKRLQYFLKAFMKRRTKDVLKKEGGLNFGKGTQANGEPKSGGFKIVERKVETVVAEFSKSERVLYDRLAARTEKSLDDMMELSKNEYIGALVLLLRLRQTCNHPDLIRGNLKKEKDALITGSQTGSGFQTPRKSSTSNSTDLDDIADMFGSLTVETKKCDICQAKLHKGNMADGAIRCADCEDDLNGYRRQSKEHKNRSKVKKISQPSKEQRRHMHSRRIVDSDDEDGQGDWIVRKSQQSVAHLGKAGGSDDEDAEGGGEWINPDDSDTGDESHVKAGKFKQKARGSTTSQSGTEADDDESTSTDKDTEDDGDKEHNSSKQTVKRLTSSTKIRRLVQILHKESAEHKFIVFSEFTSMLNLVEPFLRKEGFRFTRYDGSMKNDEREASLERLRNDPRTRILLCSLRCGSLGLNLTAASRVVILEPFWNPFVEEQAIDRVHRLNQTRDVKVYRLTIADSVEERILDLQEKKRELAKAAIEGGKAVAKLSMKDILSLFRRDAEHDAKHEDGAPVALAIGRVGGGGLLERGSLASPVKGGVEGRAGGGGAASAAFRGMGGAVPSMPPPQQPQQQRKREQPKFKVPLASQKEWDPLNPYGRRAGF